MIYSHQRMDRVQMLIYREFIIYELLKIMAIRIAAKRYEQDRPAVYFYHPPPFEQ